MATKNIYKDRECINIYNHNSSRVVISTKNADEQLLLAAKNEEGVPGIAQITWSQLEWINGTSNVFKSGLVRFGDEDDALYSILRINKDNILFNEDIEGIILNPTMEGMQRIVSTTDLQTMTRIKGVLIQLLNANAPILKKTIDIINHRYKEVSRKQLKSEITLTPKSEFKAADQSEVDILRLEMQQLQEKLTALTSGNVKKGKGE